MNLPNVSPRVTATFFAAVFLVGYAGRTYAQIASRDILTPSQVFSGSGSGDNIDLGTGNVHFALPLLSMRGRAGHDLNLSYSINSKNVTPWINEVPFSVVNENPAQGVYGGFRFGDGPPSPVQAPTLIWDNAAITSESAGTNSEGQPTYNEVYCDYHPRFFDVDGSTHDFINIASCIGPSQAHPEDETHVSETLDGAMMRLDSTNSGDIVLFRPDGSQVHFKGAVTEDIDRNGNVITYTSLGTLSSTSDQHHSTSSSAIEIKDTLARKFRLTNSIDWTFQDGVSGPIPGSTSDIKISRLNDEGAEVDIAKVHSVTTSDPVSSSSTCTNATGSSTSSFTESFDTGSQTTITVLGVPQRVYQLTTDGLGELTRLTLPSGGYIRYEYGAYNSPQQLVGNYTVIDCSLLPHRQPTAKYVCANGNGICSAAEETVTTYTPGFSLAANHGENSSMDVRTSEGRTHYDFQSFILSPDNNAWDTKETSISTYQGEDQLLKTVVKEYYFDSSWNYTSNDAIPVPQLKKVTTTVYGSADVPNATSTEEFEYFKRSYTCAGRWPWRPQVICAAYSPSTATLPTPLISKHVLKGFDGSELATVQTDWVGYSGPSTFNWSMSSAESVTGPSGFTAKAETEYDNYRDALDVTGAMQHVSRGQQRGNPTRTTVYRGGLSQPTYVYASYDDTGNVVSAKDEMGRVSRITYSDSWGSSSCSAGANSTFAFPTQTEDPGHHTSSAKYDYCTGDVLESTDPNGKTSRFWWDDYHRNVRTETPGGGWSTASRSDPYPAFEEVEAARTATETTKARAEFDGLGRLVRKSISEGNNSWLNVDYDYDFVGRIAGESNPYRGSLPSSLPKTRIEYDALSRRRKIFHPDDKFIEWEYSGRQVTAYDELRRKHRALFDAAGRMVETHELGSPSAPLDLTSTYTYDPLGNLTRITQNGDSADVPRIRRFAYDSLSQLLASYNPEQGSGLTCAGVSSQETWSTCYSYADDGQMSTKTDARNITTHFGYGDEGQLVKRWYTKPDGVTKAAPSVCFSYGPTSWISTNAVDRLTGEWTQQGDCAGTPPSVQEGLLTRRIYTQFDDMGRVQEESSCVLGNCPQGHPQSYRYDLAGNVTSYGDGRGFQTFTQSYDAAGRLASLDSSWQDALHPSSLFSIKEFSPRGWTSANAAGTMTITRSFEDISGRIKSFSVKAGAQ